MRNLIALSVLLATAGASSAAAQNISAKDRFAAKCSMCHGPDGSAQTTMGKSLKVPDFHSADVQKQTDTELKTTIAKGKGKMPAFGGKLTGEQIDQLVGYIRDMGKRKARSTASRSRSCAERVTQIPHISGKEHEITGYTGVHGEPRRFKQSFLR